MLLEFLCSNHKSIRRPVFFSTLASKDKSNIELLTNFNGNNVLRSAVLYGANGSGKSNFIDAISFVRNLVLNSINHQPGEGIRQLPHKLETTSTDSEYRIQFVTNGIRYAFGFVLKDFLVKEEYLYFFPNGKQTKIYERNAEKFSSGAKFRNKFTTCKDVLKPNRLLLSCAANFSNVDEVRQAFEFFRDELIIYNSESSDEIWMNYSLRQISENENMKQNILRLMQSLGLDICDIKTKVESSQSLIDKTVLPDFLSDEFKEKLLKENIKAISVKVVYKAFETDLFSEESTGVKKLFSILCPFIDIMTNGKTIICDELENSLHESLLQGFLRLFIENSPNKQAQLIFSTHDTSLLDLEFFRRDQIWFTELRGEDRSTDLFSLAEIKNVRKDKKFGKGYIEGRYGAIPMLNLNFADIIPNLK